MTNLTLAFFYADLGDPWWKTAVTEMLRSARRVMPDAHVVQLSPSGTAMHPWAHEVVYANLGPDAPEVGTILSKVKGYLMAQYAAAHPGETIIFTDADVIWKDRPPIYAQGAIAFDQTANELQLRQFYVQSGDVALEWGLVQTLLDELPLSTLAADVCELALNIAFRNVELHGATANETLKFMVHFPGPANRDEMIAFARSLDGGEPFKEMDPSYVPPAPPKEGVNVDLMPITLNTGAKLTIPPEPNKWQELVAPKVEGADAAE